MAWSMSTALCLMTWKVAIGRSNWTRTLAYSTARWWACSITPSRSQQSATLASSTMRRQSGGVVAVGADPLGGPAVQVETGHPPRVVPRRHGLALRRLQEEGADPLLRAGGYEGPVGRRSVEHDRLQPVQAPAARPCAWPGCGCGRPGRRGPARRRRWSLGSLPRPATAAARPARGDGRRSWRRRPRTGRARGRATCPISSSTTAMSTSPMPRPPRSSGTSRPVQPSSTSWFQTASEVPTSSSSIART